MENRMEYNGKSHGDHDQPDRQKIVARIAVWHVSEPFIEAGVSD